MYLVCSNCYAVVERTYNYPKISCESCKKARMRNYGKEYYKLVKKKMDMENREKVRKVQEKG